MPAAVPRGDAAGMETAIDVRGLRKRYRETIAVRDVSFCVERGEIFGILGPNGAGKTTTVECVEGLRQPDGGSLSVLGLDPQRDRHRLRQLLGVQLQDTQLPDRMRVGEALRLYSSFYDRPADWRELMDLLGLAGKEKDPFGKLSGGQRQRLSIALALVGNPEIVVLDELTTGLDPQARRDTWALIEGVCAGGTTVLLVTHFMEEAERLCNRVAVIDAGRVVALDSPAALAAAADAGQRISFRPATPIDDSLLRGLSDVVTVRWQGDRVTITGTGNVVNAVTSLLATHGIVAEQLRVDQASLEDAFAALVGQSQAADNTQAGSNVG
jgi:ABC-2 type transport system ATP-binding protein